MNALAATVTDDAEGRILDALLARGRLKEGDLARARPLHAEAGGSLLGLLVRLGLEQIHLPFDLAAKVNSPENEMVQVSGSLH